MDVYIFNIANTLTMYLKASYMLVTFCLHEQKKVFVVLSVCLQNLKGKPMHFTKFLFKKKKKKENTETCGRAFRKLPQEFKKEYKIVEMYCLFALGEAGLTGECPKTL